MEGLYGLRGAIGPPYIPSRHKRNHNNRNHNHNHSSHSQQQQQAGGHQRHGSLSFRNSESMDHNSWRAQTRGLTIRNKRGTAENNPNAIVEDIQRNRRDVPNCVVNLNSRRNLLIGCTKTNVIEVRPQCSDEGDEGM